MNQKLLLSIMLLLLGTAVGAWWFFSDQEETALTHSPSLPDELVFASEKGYPGLRSFEKDLLQAIGKEIQVDFRILELEANIHPKVYRQLVKNWEWKGAHVHVIRSGCVEGEITFPYFNEFQDEDEWTKCFRVRNEKIRKALNHGLAKVVKNGVYDRIYREHFDEDDHRVEWCEEWNRITVVRSVEESARCENWSPHIYSTYRLIIDGGRIQGVKAHSTLLPEADYEGEWTWQIHNGDTQEEAASDYGHAELPLNKSAQVTVRFEGEMNGKEFEIQDEPRPIDIPKIQMAVRKEGDSIRITPHHGVTDMGGRWIVAVFDRKGHMLQYQESPQWRDPRLTAEFKRLKEGDYRVVGLFYGRLLPYASQSDLERIGLFQIMALKITDRKAGILPLDGQEMTVMSQTRGKALAERIKSGEIPSRLIQ